MVPFQRMTGSCDVCPLSLFLRPPLRFAWCCVCVCVCCFAAFLFEWSVAEGIHASHLFVWNSIMFKLDACGRYVEYVHLAANSATVSVGDRVQRGQVVVSGRPLDKEGGKGPKKGGGYRGGLRTPWGAPIPIGPFFACSCLLTLNTCTTGAQRPGRLCS